MKGLKEYLDKHGKHFTEKLAWDIGVHKWPVSDLKRSVHGMVYYNVISSTVGDMLYLILVKSEGTKRDRINYAISIVSDYSYYDGALFVRWIDDIISKEKDFDLTPYI